MTNYLWYIFEANVFIVLLFGVFKLIQRFLSFGWQRFSLLSIPVLSVLAVWMKHGSISESGWSYHIPVFELETVEITPKSQTVSNRFDPVSIVETGYWIGVVLLSLWTLYHVYSVVKRFLQAKKTKEGSFTLIELPDEAPSSFFHYVQLPSGLSEYDREIIFQHEKIHAQKLHSADRLFLESVHCFSWFNPLFPQIKKELVHIHEFEVDRIMYNKYRVGYMEFLLAYSLGTSSSIYSFTNQFMTRLTLIKRIKIMKKNSKKVLIAALALPLIAGTLTLISFTRGNSETTRKVPEKPEKEAQNIRSEAALPNVGNSTEPGSKMISEEPVVNSTEKEVSKIAPEKKIELLKSEMNDEKALQFIPPVSTKSIKQETEADKMPEYAGGREAMTKYLVSNIHYPEEAVKSKTTGKVYVTFLVTKEGKVSNAAVKKGVSKELDAEAVRVISSMPNWVPAEKDGKKVDAEMVLPVSFAL